MNRIESLPCPSCGVEFNRADIPKDLLCPVCGAHLFSHPDRAARETSDNLPKPPGQTRDRVVKIGIGVIVIVIAALSYYGHSTLNEGAARRQAAEAARVAHISPGQCLTNGGYFMAKTEAALDKVTRYFRQGDHVAIAEMMSHDLVAPLAAGKTVFLDENGISTVRIRLPGGTYGFYVPREAVTCK